MGYYINALTKNFANFKGRAGRKEYWMFVLFNFIVGLILSVIGAVAEMPIITMIYTLIVSIPSFAITIRRLHDLGKSWTWFLITFIPVIGWFWMLYLTCKVGMSEANEYGVAV